MRFSKITILFVELLWWCSSDAALSAGDALFEKNMDEVEHQDIIVISGSPSTAGDRGDGVGKKYLRSAVLALNNNEDYQHLGQENNDTPPLPRPASRHRELGDMVYKSCGTERI